MARDMRPDAGAFEEIPCHRAACEGFATPLQSEANFPSTHDEQEYGSESHAEGDRWYFDNRVRGDLDVTFTKRATIGRTQEDHGFRQAR